MYIFALPVIWRPRQPPLSPRPWDFIDILLEKLLLSRSFYVMKSRKGGKSFRNFLKRKKIVWQNLKSAISRTEKWNQRQQQLQCLKLNFMYNRKLIWILFSRFVQKIYCHLWLRYHENIKNKALSVIRKVNIEYFWISWAIGRNHNLSNCSHYVLGV